MKQIAILIIFLLAASSLTAGEQVPINFITEIDTLQNEFPPAPGTPKPIFYIYAWGFYIHPMYWEQGCAEAARSGIYH